MEARGTILLIWALAAPLVASPLVYLLPRCTARLRGPQAVEVIRAPGWISAVVGLLLVGVALGLLASLRRQPVLGADFLWTREYFHFRLRADFLTVFGLLALGLVGTGWGLAMAGHPYRSLPPTARVQALWLLLLGAAVGVVLAGDAVVFLFFWGAALLPAWLLQQGSGADTARRFAAAAYLGDVFLLLGVIGFWAAAGDSYLPYLRAALGAQEKLVGLSAILLVIGLLMRAGSFPFHGWLRGAWANGPLETLPVALLFLTLSAYGLIRFVPGLTPPDVVAGLRWPLLLLGAASVLYGAFRALIERDLSRIATYAAVNQLGYLALAIGASGAVVAAPGVAGALVYLLVLGLGWGAFCLSLEAIAARTRTRDLDALGGLFAHAPGLAVAMILAVLTMCGCPGLLGFLGQRLLFAGGMWSRAWPIVVLGIFGSALTAVYGLRVVARIFWGERPRGLAPHFDPTGSAGPLLLGVVSLVFGVWSYPVLWLASAALATVFGMRAG